MSLSEGNPVIVGLGAATPVGRGAWASAAAVRAGLSGFSNHGFMVDEVGSPMRVAALPWLDPAGDVVERVASALADAVTEAMASITDALPALRVGLWLNLPPERPGLPADLDRRVAKRLGERVPAQFARVGHASLGHAGGLFAIESALSWLRAEPDVACIVAGADSYLEPDVLEWLEQTDQLHGAGERNNAWGFIPGEGAGALLLCNEHTAARLQLPIYARIRANGTDRESELIGTGSVCLAKGLTQAVRKALVGLAADERLTDVFCDMNGEPYRADEYAFLVTRTREHFVAASEFTAPADCWGDMGSATVPLLVMLASIAGVKRYSRGDLALIWASSVSGERAAVLLQTAASDSRPH